MAVIHIQFCPGCGRDASFTLRAGQPIPSLCDNCRSNDQDLEKITELAKQAVKPIDQRLAEIEEWIYDQKHKKVFYNDSEIIG